MIRRSWTYKIIQGSIFCDSQFKCPSFYLIKNKATVITIALLLSLDCKEYNLIVNGDIVKPNFLKILPDGIFRIENDHNTLVTYDMTIESYQELIAGGVLQKQFRIIVE